MVSTLYERVHFQNDCNDEGDCKERHETCQVEGQPLVRQRLQVKFMNGKF